LSDQVSSHSVRAAEYLAIVLFPLSLIVFEHAGPKVPSKVTTMKMLEARWQEKLTRQKLPQNCLSHIVSHCVWG
jgi:aconitase A